MNPVASFDASIPVLTEILHAAGSPDIKVERNIDAEAPAIAQGEPAPAATATAEPRPDAFGDTTWNMLEQQLSERIFQQLQQHITTTLEQRMAAMLHHALLGLGQEMRNGLHISIEQIVAQELAQLKADMQKNNAVLS